MIPPQVTQQRREEAQAEPTYHCPTNTVQLATVVQELLTAVADLAMDRAIGFQSEDRWDVAAHYEELHSRLLDRREEVEELRKWLLQFTSFPQVSEKEQS